MRYRRFRYRYTRVLSDATSAALQWTWSDRSMPVAPTAYRPPTDLMETTRGLVARIDLAGVAEENVDVRLYSDALIVSGRRECPHSSHARFHTAEIRYGAFRVAIPLPFEVDVGRAQASYERGFLCIEMPLAGDER